MLQTASTSRYAGAFGRYPRRTKSRKDALPLASFLFILSIAILSFVYRKNIAAQPAAADPESLLGVVTSRSGSSYGDLCNEDKFWGNKWTLSFLLPGIIFAFVGLALVTDDYFVSALERICERLDLTEDVAGATFMAAGSSTPEFFASMLGTFVTRDQVGIGTIVGSAVFNILVIVGLSAALAGAVLELDWRPLMRDSFFYVVSIALLMLFTLAFGGKGNVKWYEGLILVATYAVYVLFMAYGNKPYMKFTERFVKKSDSDPASADVEQGANSGDAAGAGSDQERTDLSSWDAQNAADAKKKYRDLPPRTRLKVAQYAVIAAKRLATSSSSNSELFPDTSGPSGESAEVPEKKEKQLLGVELPSSAVGWILFPFTWVWSVLFRYTIVDCADEKKAHLWWVTFATSIVWISGISYIMVEAARISGCLIGIPATAMGLTVLAAGTSVPDALASISVARGGAGDMAVSNAIGSNVFDILLGLGFPWFLGDLTLRTADNSNPIHIPTEPLSEVVVPILILFGILIVFVGTLMAVRWKLRPILGYILFGIYGAFVTYTLLDVFVFSKK